MDSSKSASPSSPQQLAPSLPNDDVPTPHLAPPPSTALGSFHPAGSTDPAPFHALSLLANDALGLLPPRPTDAAASHAAGPSTQPGDLVSTSPTATPALIPPFYYPALPIDEADLAGRFSDGGSSPALLSRLYADRDAFNAAFDAARHSHTSRAAFDAARHNIPAAFDAARHSEAVAFNAEHYNIPTDPSELGRFLGLCVSEALRLGEPPIPATTEPPPLIYWELGASTGHLTTATPYSVSVYKPKRMQPLAPAYPDSNPAREFLMKLRSESSSSTHPDFGTPTSPVKRFIPAQPVASEPALEDLMRRRWNPPSSFSTTSSIPAHPDASDPALEDLMRRRWETPSSFSTTSSIPAHPDTPDPVFHTGGKGESSSSSQLRATPSSNFNIAAKPFYPTAESSQFRYFDQTAVSSPVRARSSEYEETRMMMLHHDVLDVTLLTRVESAGPVIGLLEEGDQEIRSRLLASIKVHLHKIMENGIGKSVLEALLRCSKDQHDVLESLVQAFVERNDTIWRRWTVRRAEHSDDIWMASLQSLFRAVSGHPDLCEIIVSCLIRENIMWNARGPELLIICFDSFPYNQAKTLIQQATEEMGKNLHESQFGSKFLEQCFSKAKDDELRELEEAVLNRVTKMANGNYSNYVLQKGVEHGTDGFLQKILGSFIDLPQANLAELVTGRFSNFCVLAMLNRGTRRAPAMARRLAERISMLPANVFDHPNASQILGSMNRALEL